MSEMWFERELGSPVSKGITDPTSLLLGHGAPDWVRLPQEIGGTRAKVVEAIAAPCPCESGHTVRHLILDLPVSVAEFPLKGFLWYERPEPPTKREE